MESKTKGTEDTVDDETLALIKGAVGSGAEMVTEAACNQLDKLTALSNMLGMDKAKSEALAIQVAMESGAQLIATANKRYGQLMELHAKECKGCKKDPEDPLYKAIEGLAKRATTFTVTLKRKEA